MPKVQKDKVSIVQPPSGIESIRITKKGAPPKYVPFTPKELSVSAKKAFQNSLTMIMAHVADFHMVALTTISKKYGHSIDEMVETIMESSECKSIIQHPVLRDLDSELTAENIPTELQQHPDGIYTDKTETPFYYTPKDENSDEDIIISPSPKKKAVIIKKKSVIAAAFDDSSSDNDQTDKEIIYKTKKLKISKK